jgi:hypothetical protein
MPTENETSSWSPEVNLKVSFKLKDGKKESLTKMFKYIPSVASITAKGQERVDGAQLLIPLELDVERSGSYKITANLFSQTSKKPIAHLVGEESLLESGGTVWLKVSAILLKEQKDPGPYLLQDIIIARIPDSFEEPRMFGDATGRQFEIEGFELNHYSEEEEFDSFEQAKVKRFQQYVKSLAGAFPKYCSHAAWLNSRPVLAC